MRVGAASACYSSCEPAAALHAGGNVGYTALQFSLLFPNATIITVEPDPDNFVQLKKNIAG